MRRTLIVAVIAGLVGAIAAAAGGAAGGHGSHADDEVAFRSPTGNIRCVIGANARLDDARCGTLNPRRAAQIVRGKRGREISRSAVAGIPAGAVLRYGRTVTAHGMLCRSKANGVTCVDRRTKRGFRIAKEGVVILPVPAPSPAPARRPAPSGGGGGCDPNYSGACVPRYPPDVDCSDVGTTVRVVGRDVHNLDADGNGWGCESY